MRDSRNQMKQEIRSSSIEVEEGMMYRPLLADE
jgi:hypothetical protein